VLELLSRLIGPRAMLFGMLAATLLFTIGYFASSPHSFSLPKFNMLNPSRAASAVIGKGRVSSGTVKKVPTWIVLYPAAFVSAGADGHITVAYRNRQFGLRLYYLDGFNSTAVPYLAGLLKNAPLTVVTRWEGCRGAFGAFITLPALQRDLAALLVEQSLASIGGVQPPPPASTRERYLAHLTSLRP
jgi:hypothetical protein